VTTAKHQLTVGLETLLKEDNITYTRAGGSSNPRGKKQVSEYYHKWLKNCHLALDQVWRNGSAVSIAQIRNGGGEVVWRGK
jgi:hypothetical protein